MAKDLAIVLNNGSVNSAVATTLAAQKYRLVLLHLEQADDAAPRARAAYEQQVAHFKPYREHTLPMGFLTALGGAAEPSAAAADPRTPASITPVLIDLLPHVAVAARYAVHYSASAVYVGIRVGSHAHDLAQSTEYLQVW